MSEQVWSEWIEHKPGACPIPWASFEEYELRFRDGLQFPEYTPAGHHMSLSHSAVHFYECWHHHGAALGYRQITEYRYRLDRAPAGFVPPGQDVPWVPEQLAGHGPWIEFTGAMPDMKGQFLLKREREARKFGIGGSAFPLSYYNDSTLIAAYCVKLEDQPTAAEIEATQKPPTPTLDAMEDELAENRPMFDADDVGVLTGKWARHNARAALSPATPAPPFMVSPMRSSDGLLTEWRGDHRLGGWQA